MLAAAADDAPGVVPESARWRALNSDAFILSYRSGEALAQSDIAIATQRNPDKELLWTTVLGLREQGMSYREIAQAVGLHWTRIQQIVKLHKVSNYVSVSK